MDNEKLIDKGTSVLKSNELSTSNLSTKLNLNQMQLFAYAILSTQRDGRAEFQKHEFEKQFDLKQYHTNVIREDCDKITDLKIRYYKGDNRWGSFQVFTDMDYINGTVIFKWHERMLKHITELKNRYTRLDLSITKNFKSSYSWTLYEYLLAKYGYYSLEFSKQELMELFNVADRKTYINNTSDFKGRVLDVAVAEINEHTELTVKYEQVRRGRSITGFKIYFSRGKTVAGATAKQTEYIVDLLAKLKDEYYFKTLDIADAGQSAKANQMLFDTLRIVRTIDFSRLTHDKADELIKALNSTIKLIDKMLVDDKDNTIEKDKYAHFEIPIYGFKLN